MNGTRKAPKIATAVSGVLLAVGVAGAIVTALLNAFVFADSAAYGEVAIPGSAELELPAGEVVISYHAVTATTGASVIVPSVKLRFEAPAGAPTPVLTDRMGGTTTSNRDVRVQIGSAQVGQAGRYRVFIEGSGNENQRPRLSFGHGSPYGSAIWPFVGLIVLAAVALPLSILWWISADRRNRPLVQATYDEFAMPVPPAGAPTELPDDQGVRLERLKTLAALRQSGALTEAEFQSEKRRILNDPNL
ncbi:SHOCT domain-containing protein [Mycobacterium dioxanotrophicus]|uniref:SHOCT domain-containing protein n=1 Tax=Mycobacterium dioxanotrophicus TaxID=482462 RepID=UPI0012FAEB84|nr:SHOCT domain-containing protein [Mycobacterium dioxanotrophicus]